MAKNKEQQKEEIQKKPSVKSQEFILKKSLNGKPIGSKIQVGPKGEKFYKRLNII